MSARTGWRPASFAFVVAIALSLGIAPGAALASMDDLFSIEGVITGFDTTHVTIVAEGKKVSVPRGSIPAYFPIRPGSRVVAFVVGDQVRYPSDKKAKRK